MIILFQFYPAFMISPGSLILIIYMVKLDRIHVAAVLQPASLAVCRRLLCCPGAVAQLRPVRLFIFVAGCG